MGAKTKIQLQISFQQPIQQRSLQGKLKLLPAALTGRHRGACGISA